MLIATVFAAIDAKEAMKDNCSPAAAVSLAIGCSLMTAAEAMKPTVPRHFPQSCLLLSTLVGWLILGLMGCGGGSSGSPPPPPPPPAPDFSLSLSPTSQTVSDGNSVSISLSATAMNGFSSQITVQLAGIPSGVTVSPSNIILVPGTPQQITFSATNTAPAAAQTVMFTGTSGVLTHTAPLSLSVTGPSNGAPGRTRYVRTDATTEYFTWINQHWIVYNPGTSRFFVTDPISNHIYVLDATSETVVGSISVPGAYGMSDTPDHKTLYVGTLFGDVYAIDPVGMSVSRRYIASQIGPYGFSAQSALVLADGRLVLLGEQGGIPSVDGSTSIAIWNPTDNSFTLYGATGQINGMPLPCGGFMGNIGGFALTADRTKILLGSIDSDGTLCEVDPATGQGLYVSATSFSLNHFLTSPDGKYIIEPSYPTDVVLYDAQTLTKVAQFSILGDTSSASGFAISADSKTLFAPTDTIVYAYDLSSQQLVGWISNIFVVPSSGGGAVGPINSPYLLAADGTGLFAGPMEEGVGFLDLSALEVGPVGTQITNAYLNPASGPISGGSQAKWSSQIVANIQGPVYFGNQKSPQVANSNGNITATTPPGPAGPVSIFSFATDGAMQVIPDGFSYGPTILQVTPNMSTAEGGGTGVILGYGLGPIASSVVPPDLQIKIGGTAATITSFNWNAYGLLSPPYPLQSFSYTLPPASTGSVDVQVTNNSGTATATAAMTYLPASQPFPLPGSTLEQGIYDAHRDLYYFTDTNQIQIFSLTQKKWLSPISIPAPPGATQRLWGLALSPDGSKLAVSDASAAVIYVLNPAQPNSVKTFPVTSQAQTIANPCGVAISNSGVVYFITFVQGGTGFSQYFKLDSNTGVVTDYHFTGPGLGTSDAYLRNAISADGARVFYNNMGYVFSIDTATDKIFSANIDPGCCYGDYDLTLSSNQTSLEATEYLYDTNLNAKSSYSLNDREILNTGYVYGAKLSPDGRLLFQPSINGIDVLDGNIGNLLDRLAVPFTLSTGYDALVADSKDNILIAITGANSDGIAVIDLASVQEPPLLSYSHGTAPRADWRTKSRPSSNSGALKTLPGKRSRTISHMTSPRFPQGKWRSGIRLPLRDGTGR